MRGAGLIRSLAEAGRDVLSLALPRHCPACDEIVDTSRPLCDGCAVRLRNLRESPCCGRCASPIPDAAGPCGRCKDRGLSPYAAIARLTTFESITREIIHGIKYGRRWSNIPWLTGELAKQPNVRACLAASDAIVPVPLHWTKRLSRGFNQAELLADALASIASLKVARAVRRVQMTRSQTLFDSRKARQENIHSAFRLTRPDLLDGRNVLIVDDVMTTGATLQAMTRAIKDGRCRPKSFRAVVVASANPLETDLAV